METGHDILLRYNGENAEIKVDDGEFKITLNDNGSLAWASEKYGGIENGARRARPYQPDQQTQLRRFHPSFCWELVMWVWKANLELASTAAANPAVWLVRQPLAIRLAR